MIHHTLPVIDQVNTSMKKHPRIKKLFFAAGITFTVFFIFSCLTPFIAPASCFFTTYAALLFPYSFFAYLLWLCFVLLYYRKYFAWFLVIMIPAWKNISTVFSFHIPHSFSYKKESNQLRVLSWNIDNFLYAAYSGNDLIAKQDSMLHFIRQMDADILCFQDYSEAAPEFAKANSTFIRDSLGYPNAYFSMDAYNYGTYIFSRLPILDSGHIQYSGKINPESLAYVDLAFQKQKIRVYNTHLYSMYVHTDTLKPRDAGYQFFKEDSAFVFHSTRLQRLAFFDKLHTEQAKLIRKELQKTKTPYLFCADLNSVPSSYVYQYIKKGMTDAFLQKGSGLGGTFHRFSLTLRIDVLLMSKGITASQYYSPQLDLSDHYPIVTDISLQK